MDSPFPLNEKVESILRKRSEKNSKASCEPPTILVATADPEIRSGLSELFQEFSVNAIWLSGVEAAKRILAKEKVSACMCGFWLQDGTYRELVRHIRRGRVEIPVILVSAPACPDEYRDYLSAINIGALDFLSHPYRKSELERMLWLGNDSSVDELPSFASILGAGEAA
jgi:DNA-binding NtrC family response regulator